MKRELRAAFFDMGETLYTYKAIPLNWKDHYPEAWTRALAQIGVEPSMDRLDLLEEYMEQFNTRKVAREVEYDAEHIFTGAIDVIGVDITLHQRASRAFFDYFRQTLTPYRETVQVLNNFRENGVYIGALTDVAYGMPEHFIADDLEQVDLLELMDSWKTSVQVGVRKPNPKGLLMLCLEADCEPAEAVYVGNEPKDIECANAAGLISVLIHRSDSSVPEWGQDYTITSLSECEDIFEGTLCG
ncbi:HAD family hydrolase [Desulfovibrio inopinatus]|uniref:HAD family hydrolase n=1 Tax=Desulfovibrio inopinatus TaxID=102109 RepID=UPI000429A043|nr:HAD family hydrolase [Desulfovibrio inopinatus]